MHLQRLEIQGFKSFARKTVLEFGTGITAIVGPNGSGKSNVADSLRWVLGEQSPKLIRGKKSDDVIFAGSDTKGRAGFAEVIAVFDNRDHKIPLDASEVSIGRRIDRSGESEYLINGAKVRLLDIVDLVLRSNIGTSRYTVIGQGTIDQMILAGPAEIKNLLDEASGVKTYFTKRDKTLKRLEQTAENLMRAEDLLKELEPRVKSLRRQAKRMEARDAVVTQLQAEQQLYFTAQYQQLHAMVVSAEQAVTQLATQRAQLQAQLDQHIAAMQAAETAASTELSRSQSLQQELHKHNSQKNNILEQLSIVRGKLQSQHTGSRGDAASLHIEQHQLEQQLQTVQQELAQAQATLVTHTAQRQELNQAVMAVTQQLDAIYKALAEPTATDWSALTEHVDALEKSFAVFETTLAAATDITSVQHHAQGLLHTWQTFRQAAREATRNPQQESQRLQSQLQSLSQHKDAVTADLHRVSTAISETQVRAEFLTQQQQRLEQQLRSVALELTKATSTDDTSYIAELQNQEKDLQAQLQAATQRITAIETEQQTMFAADSQRKTAVATQEQQLRAGQQAYNALRDQESAAAVQQARVSTQLESLLVEVEHALGADGLAVVRSRPERVTIDMPAVAANIAKLQKQLEAIGSVDDLTLQEYHETEERFSTLEAQITDLRKGMEDLRAVMDEFDAHIKTAFNEAFAKVNTQFEQYFRMLFNGGRAHLSLVKAGEESDESAEDIAEAAADNQTMRPEEKLVAKYEKGALAIAGVEIKATPPGKKLANIQSLSGGERSLTSIALLCSLLTCFPSPFVVLDEVDAALDEANTIRFGQILGTLAHQTQFITITHNRETMAQAHILYGVTMGDDGISKLLSLKMDQATAYAK